MKVKNNSKELSAPRPPTVVVKEEDAEAVAVEVMASVAETVNVVETANAVEVMVNSVVAIVLVASVVDAAKAVVVADVARVDPRLPLLKDRKVLPLLNALNVEEKERDSKASPVKVLTPWTVTTVPDVDNAETAKVELLARALGVMKRNLFLKVKLQLLRVRQSPPPSTENANQESPASPVRDARDPLRKKRNPNPSSKKRRKALLSMTTSTKRKPRTLVFSRRLKSAPTTRSTPKTSPTLRAAPISSPLEPAR